MKKFFEYQAYHFLLLALIIIVVYLCVTVNPETLTGAIWGIDTVVWFWLAIAVPVLHQMYVWIVWRLELYQRTFTKQFGLERAFKMYAIGFSILFGGRLITIIILSVSNSNTLGVYPVVAYSLSLVMACPVIYLFYSVKKYFTVERAYGIDHFDSKYRKPFEKKGIFKYTDNGMYVFGLMILYFPGLLFLSKAAILAALFNHVYIWVHYYLDRKSVV